MIVLELHNNIGMGNQFYLYAYAYALSRREKQEIIIFSRMNEPTRKYVLHLFTIGNSVTRCYRLDKIQNRVIWKMLSGAGKYLHILFKWRFYYYKESKGDNRKYQEIPKGLHNYWIAGNFECHRYFDEYRSDLIKQFQYNGVISDKIKKWINIIDKDAASVALHIRRGDFKRLGRSVPIKFYEDAITYFKSLGGEHTFYLVTEDMEVVSYFKDCPSVKYIHALDSENRDIEEWLCLLHCKDHIVTNSTYSWWAAYLSEKEGKRVITISQSLYEKLENTKGGYEEFYLSEWMPLEER